MIHLDWSLLKCILLDFEDLDVSLVPLEGMKSLLDMRDKTVFDVIVNSQIPLNQVAEALDDLIRVLIEQSLKSSQRFKFIEILLELSIKISEDI